VEEWFEQYLHLTADELGIVLALALPLLALWVRRVRVMLLGLADRVALAFGLPRHRYRRWFIAEYGMLRNIYLNRVETLELADSYISLSVHAENEANGSLLPATTLMAPSGPRRIVIVGDPGTGKSTLLKAYGSGVLRRPAGDSELNTVRRTHELPVLIILRQVSDFLVRGGRLEDHVVGVLAEHTGSRRARAMFRRLLHQGQIVLLLDGLDEVSRNAYEAVRAAIHAFVNADEDATLPTSMARVVITCRRQNYREIQDDWEGWFSTTSYAIAALRDAEIERFVTRREAQFSAERPAAAFLADIAASGTTELHRVPLILTISVGLYTQLAAYEIPHSIGAFYDEMIRELLRRHDFRAEGQLRMNKYRAEDKHRFLRELALHLARTRRSPFADFPYADVVDFCETQRRTMPRLRDPYDFVDEIINRSGLLSRTGDDGYLAFAHRALHEYLAAAQLARDPRPGSDFLLSRLPDPEWRQVSVLFSGENNTQVEHFLRNLAETSPDLACQCLAAAEVSADVAADLISRARRSSMLSPIMEAVKSPVPETRSLAFDALRTELLWIAGNTDPPTRRRIFAALFGGQLPMAGKVLLAMAEYATPEMASAIVQLASAMPDDEPALVAPLWHCLAIADIERQPDIARKIIGRLLVLSMDRECATTLELLPPVRARWSSAEDRLTAYPLKRGLPLESNLVALLGFGQALCAFDDVPRKNLYLKALAEPGQPLAQLESSSFLSKLSLYRMTQILAHIAFSLAAGGTLTMAALAADDRIRLILGPGVIPLCVSLATFTVMVLALSARAVRRYNDHIYAADFSLWCYVVPAVDGAAFSLSRVEPLWALMAGRPWRNDNTVHAFSWLAAALKVLTTHLLVTAVYGLPIAAALWRWPWLIPAAVIPVLLLYCWLPSTELCGPHTVLSSRSTRQFLNIYQDPASQHWVLPSGPPTRRLGLALTDRTDTHQNPVLRRRS
jgi:hypothetical protein